MPNQFRQFLGSIAKGWSGPFIVLSRVKCFSITLAPIAAAAHTYMEYPWCGPKGPWELQKPCVWSPCFRRFMIEGGEGVHGSALQKYDLLVPRFPASDERILDLLHVRQPRGYDHRLAL